MGRTDGRKRSALRPVWTAIGRAIIKSNNYVAIDRPGTWHVCRSVVLQSLASNRRRHEIDFVFFAEDCVGKVVILSKHKLQTVTLTTAASTFILRLSPNPVTSV